ncbi:MAG: aspartyl-tRNA(Asn)/glutamyl-tRNA(Gln) amidotransferase subunit [Betaproteobacteria bacterium]
MTEAHWLSAVDISAAYAQKRLSPVELVQALTARIEKLNPQLNAFIDVGAERALDAARVAEKEIHAGRTLGPLHGVPIALKDIIDVAGLRTSCHSKLMQNHVAHSDAAVVSRLRAAGAILLGKLSLHEFAYGGPSFDLPFPPARNPWNRNHHPGGSSSGSGAAIAAGLAPLSLGTDTGGSIRNPAGACGIAGLKPTYGLVSRRGVFPLSYTLDHIGPLARSVRDIALLLGAISAHDSADPGSAATQAHDFSRDLERGVRGLRVGVVRHFHQRDMQADPEMGAAIEEAVRVLEREGAATCDVTLPPLLEVNGVQRVILMSESWAVHAAWLREQPENYAASTRRKLMSGAFLTAEDYVQAQRCRSQIIGAVNDAFKNVDVLLTANAMEPACRIDDEESINRTYSRQARSPFNLTGHPALAMMSGLSKSGLPLSVQLVGRYFDEVTLLRVAQAYERAAEWTKRRPPV